MYNEILFLVSNIMVSFYGVLIKYYKNISIFEQLFLRTLSFIIISIYSLGYSNQLIYENILSYESFALSIVNLSSIYGIYLSFSELGIGITNSLFYTWPIFLYLIAIPVLNTQFSIKSLTILLIITFAIFLVLSDNMNTNNINYSSIGIIGLIISIATHIFTILYFKKKESNVHKYLLKQYGFGLIILLSIYILNNDIKSFHISKEYLYILLFSMIFGYFGFYQNFNAIKKLNPYSISILQTLSICLSFIIGYLFFNEKTTGLQWIGVLIIIIMNYYSFSFLKI